MNDKADKFRKSQLKEVAAQTESVTEVVQRLQQMLFGLSLKVFNLEKQLGTMGAFRSVASAADYRSNAIAKLLAASNAGITEDQIKAKVLELQVKDFDDGSAQDDQERNLSTVTNRAAQMGDIVIGTISLFKDGQEIPDEGLVRTKIELGKKEIFSDSTLDETVVGMQIGESRMFPLNLQGKTDQGQFTLLGLRALPAPAPVASLVPSPIPAPDAPAAPAAAPADAPPAPAPVTTDASTVPAPDAAVAATSAAPAADSTPEPTPSTTPSV